MCATMILSFLLSVALTPRCNPCACLPSGVGSEEIVSVQKKQKGGAAYAVTVGATLKQLRARCHKSKLVDTLGREIYFYRLNGCWGNPPADYQEILGRQREELGKLRKRYHVIEMTCNTDGLEIN
jgi:hypothetical protein